MASSKAHDPKLDDTKKVDCTISVTTCSNVSNLVSSSGCDSKTRKTRWNKKHNTCLRRKLRMENAVKELKSNKNTLQEIEATVAKKKRVTNSDNFKLWNAKDAVADSQRLLTFYKKTTSSNRFQVPKERCVTHRTSSSLATKDTNSRSSINLRSTKINDNNIFVPQCIHDDLDDTIDDKDDSLYVLEDDDVTATRKKKKSRSRKHKLLKELSEVYKRQEKRTSNSYCVDRTLQQSSFALPSACSYRWIYDLKESFSPPSSTTPFHKFHLVVLRVVSNDFFSKSWSELKAMSSNALNKSLKGVIVIPRTITGQVYIINGLQKSPHFSAYINASKELEQLCSTKNVPFYKYDRKSDTEVSDNRSNSPLSGLFVHNFSSDSGNKELKNRLQSLFEDMAEGMLEAMFQTVRILILSTEMALFFFFYILITYVSYCNRILQRRPNSAPNTSLIWD